MRSGRDNRQSHGDDRIEARIQVDHAGLDRGAGQCLVASGGVEPVAAYDQHVLDASVGQLGAHVPRELFLGLDPDTQDVLDPVHVH